MMREFPHEAVTFFSEWPEASAGPAGSSHKIRQINILCRLPNNERRQDDEKLKPRVFRVDRHLREATVNPNLSSGSL